MGTIFKNASTFLDTDQIDSGSIFVEIGSDRGEGSTKYFANLAMTLGCPFITVDIVGQKYNFCTWYNCIKGSTWPDCDNLDDFYNLPEYIKNEINREFGGIDQFKFSLSKEEAANTNFVIEKGSVWSKNFKEYNKKISCLYLDNFDYIWNVEDVPEWCVQQIESYRGLGIDMNNFNCQVEHLSQMLNLLPYMAKNSIIICDDTYRYNDCWIGKCGAVIPLLVIHGYQILLHQENGIILGRNN